MKHIVIAPVGDQIDDLYVGIREFPTERIILISDSSMLGKAEDAKKGLEKFQIPVQIRKLPDEGHVWEKNGRGEIYN